MLSGQNMTKYHHQKSIQTNSILREVVFGIEDGMVSTLGALTGIAVGSGEQYTVLLAGLVVISVESISMGIGSYLSNKSQKEADERKIDEEKEEIKEFPAEERRELLKMFIRDGWPKKLAAEMSRVASKNRNLMLKDMSYRELGISKFSQASPAKKGLGMFLAYLIGGMVPLLSYFVLPIGEALEISVVITLTGLFGLGVAVSRYTKKSWFKTGMRILFLGGTAFIVGFLVGNLASTFK